MKKFFLSLAVITAIVMTAAIAAPFLIDINRFRGPILEAVQRQSGRGVEAGHISWSLLPSLSVRLDEVAVHENVDLASTPAFTAKAIEVQLRWGPLLHKQVDIKSVILTQPKIALRRSSDGRITLGEAHRTSVHNAIEETLPAQDKPLAQPASEGKAEKKSLDWEHFRLARLSIVDGTAQVATETQDGKQRKWDVDKLHADITHIAIGEKIRVKVSARLATQGQSLPLQLSGWIGPLGPEIFTDTKNFSWKNVPGEIRLSMENANAQAWGLVAGDNGLAMAGQADLDLTLRQGDPGNISFQLDFQGDDLDFRVPGKFKKSAGEKLRVEAAGEIAPDKISVEKAKVRISSAQATIRGVSYQPNSCDFAGSLDAAINVEDLLPFIDAGQAVAEGKAAVHLEISGNANHLRDTQVEGTVDLDSLRLRWPGILKRALEGKGSVQIQKDLIRLRALEIKIGRSDLRLDGKIRLRGDAPGEGTLESDFLDLEEVLNVFERPAPREGPAVRGRSPSGITDKKNKGKEGPIVKALPVAGSPMAGVANQGLAGVTQPGTDQPKGLAKWVFEGDCRIREMVYGRNRMTDLQGRLILSEGMFTLSKFSGAGYQGTLSTALQVDLLDPQFAFRWGLRLSDMQINDIVQANSNFGQRLFGRLTSQVELTGGFAGGADGLLRSLDGAGQVEVRDMRIATFNMMNNLSALTGLLGIRQDALEETRFDQLTTKVQIRQGRVFTPDLQALGNNFHLAGRGSFGFDRTLDYDVQVRLTRQLTGRLGQGELAQALLDKDGTVQIPFAIRGRIDGPPRLEPRWDDLLVRRATDFLTRKIFKRKSSQPTQEQEPSPYDPYSPGLVPTPKSQSSEPSLEDLIYQIIKK